MLGVREGNDIRVIGDDSLESLLARGVDLATYGRDRTSAEVVSADDVTFLPPLTRPPKIICIGLNYADHTRESKYEQPDYPTIFFRVHTSLIAHRQPMIRPNASDSLDFEGEIAAVLGKGGRYISREDALSCVAGYALFNDGSVREYQFKSPNGR
ncbi:fumarylacetoacetate (FAA) hydrolase family protein [Burkholderia cepacia]|nr:fumarylacetoacetate (FAA) hydrolase family protein [Burkholderia cepacia]